LNAFIRSLLVLALVLIAVPLRAENRAIDGSGNNISIPTQGAASKPFIRFGYQGQFFGPNGGLPTESQRPSARTISNAVSSQSASHPSARNLSNYIWAWGQFLTHDTDLSTTSNGAAVNGTAPIAVNSPDDPMWPNPIPFTRCNFDSGDARSLHMPINEVTSYIDASNVYGSDAVRANILRTNGGTGAKLVTDINNLLPRNTAGLPNENNGAVPSNQLFLAGDIRSNENSLLTSLHTIFAREHNRIVDRISAQPNFYTDEEKYQLARKIVGAEMQAITYREFLPALLGTGPTIPKAEQYVYQSQTNSQITTAHAFAAFRFGHSAVTSQLNLVDENGTAAGSLALRDVFFNPTLISSNPQIVDNLLQGAATQRSEEIDTLVVDDLRNFLFSPPPGAAGLDLASLNIQRGRDTGTPGFSTLASSFGAIKVSNFSQITSDPTLASALQTLYGSVGNADSWVAGLAEDHVAGASVGTLFRNIIADQFRRLRDGDRLFYRANAAGLYTNGVLNPEIATLIDLDHLTLADIIEANTSIDQLQNNVFFVPQPGDFNGDGMVDTADYVVWRKTEGTANVWADADGSGTVGTEDLDIWRANFGNGTPAGAAGTSLVSIPEPSTAVLLVIGLSLFRFNICRLTARR
jgi:peroxidase